MKNQPEPQHHKQQAGSSEAQKRQCHTRERKDARHSTNIDNYVRHDQSEHSSYEQPHRWIAHTVYDE